MNGLYCKELEEFNDYLIEYLEKSGIHFYMSFINNGILQQEDVVQFINNRVKLSVKKSFKKQ